MGSGARTAKSDESACSTKVRLMHEYNAALSEYSRTVSFLYQRMGTLPKRDYQEISDFTEVARLRSEGTRLTLEQHIAEHGC
jgi:molybdate-binding protein